MKDKAFERGQNPDTQKWARAIQTVKAIACSGTELRKLKVSTRNILVVY